MMLMADTQDIADEDEFHDDYGDASLALMMTMISMLMTISMMRIMMLKIMMMMMMMKMMTMAKRSS